MSSNKLFVSYETVHNEIKKSAQELKNFDPELLIAISGGGLIPSYVMHIYYSWFLLLRVLSCAHVTQTFLHIVF